VQLCRAITIPLLVTAVAYDLTTTFTSFCSTLCTGHYQPPSLPPHGLCLATPSSLSSPPPSVAPSPPPSALPSPLLLQTGVRHALTQRCLAAPLDSSRAKYTECILGGSSVLVSALELAAVAAHRVRQPLWQQQRAQPWAHPCHTRSQSRRPICGCDQRPASLSAASEVRVAVSPHYRRSQPATVYATCRHCCYHRPALDLAARHTTVNGLPPPTSPSLASPCVASTRRKHRRSNHRSLCLRSSATPYHTEPQICCYHCSPLALHRQQRHPSSCRCLRWVASLPLQSWRPTPPGCSNDDL
jgi:hypothetical protein